MDDLISRQDAINELEKLAFEMERWDELFQIQAKGVLTARNIIECLPSAQQWIPCSERLPNTNGCYLVWRPQFFGREIGMPTICYWDGSDTWHDSYGVDFTRTLNKDDVTAWMPLPEPWKGEEDDKTRSGLLY